MSFLCRLEEKIQVTATRDERRARSKERRFKSPSTTTRARGREKVGIATGRYPPYAYG